MHIVKTPIFLAQQIRELERLAKERFGLLPQSLMQRAGKAAFDFLIRRWPQTHKLAVFCGGGNNGGDGYVLAQVAHERGLKVTIWQVGKQDKLSIEANEALIACEKAGIVISIFNDKIDLEHPDVIVDAMCGIGLQGLVRDEVMIAIERMQRLHAPILALDVPSGIDADTGQILGVAVRATATITFIGLKPGLLTGSGIAYTGELALNNLQLPPELLSYIEPVAEKIHFSALSHYLKPRLRDWHKGLSGHVLVVGGALGYSGAPRMAAEAALRVGAGLVSVATLPKNAEVMNSSCPEIMCHGVETVNELIPLTTKADVIVLGPGLGQSEWAKELWTHICSLDKSLVIDADGLNLLSQTTLHHTHWVLTPHPGEAARLLNESVETIQQNRLAALVSITRRYGGVCILKGAGSLIAAPNSLPMLCDKGNPGMASAGMGDILSGVIGGLIAQGIPIGDAAKLGVYLHAAAGDLAAKEGERGMIAMDLMPHLRRLSNLTA
ncbi:MAG: NAD(P)H-hydrate dehydratase [Gammaproteobacteria bacterium]|nr:NAD(P)H-hydrate dehydratase [Gammaproteobacteria bacterium]